MKRRILGCNSRSLWRNTAGTTAVEYGLLAALIVIAAMAAAPTMGGWVNQVITATADKIPSS